MKKILKLKRLFITISLCLIMLGINSFLNIPKQENPDLGSLYTQVEVRAIGMNSEEIDSQIIEEINSSVSKIDGIGDVLSFAYDNFALVTIVYDIDAKDVRDIEINLINSIQNMTFADNVNVEIKEFVETSDLLYVFNEDNLDKAYEFENELYELDAVKTVSISDYQKPYYKMTLDNNTLLSYGLNSSMIQQLLVSKGIDATLGIVEDKPVITSNSYSSIDEIKSIIVANVNETVITLDMISDFELVEDRNYSNTYNGENALFLSVSFESDIDVTKIGDEVKEIHKDYDEFEPISFSPDYVESSINQINSTLLVGMLLVMIVSIFSLGFRGALTILITFPLTVFTTVLFLDLVNIPLQNVSIAGLIISIGIIVDNAIVIVDAMIHELEEGNEIEVGILSVIRNNTIPIFTSTLTTIVAFTPLLLLPGVAGKMASSLPLTVIVALICSFLSAIFVIPIIGSKLLVSRNRKNLAFLDVLIKGSLKYPKLNVIIVIVLLVTSLTSVYIMQPIQLFPTAEKEYIFVDFELSDANNINDVIEVKDMIESQINSDKIVSSLNYYSPSFYSSLVASSATPNSGRILYINKKDNAKEMDRIKKVLNEKLEDTVSFNVSEVMMNSPGAPIQVILHDVEETSNVVEKLGDISGIENIQATEVSYTNKYNFSVNKEKALQLNINEGQVFNEIALLINDQNIDVLNIDGASKELVISNNINNIDELLNQTILLNAQPYKLSDIVEIEDVSSPIVVSRTDFKIANTISVYVDSKYSVYEVHDKVSKVLDDEGVSYTIKGEKELTQTVFTNVLYAGVAALILIFLILLAQFNSFKKVVIILTSILFSLIGSALFLILFNQPITFTATLGLVSLMGIVVNNGILLVDYIDKSEEVEIYNKCVSAVKRRSRPIITSNITTIIGLIPLVIVGSDFFKPMAITLVGGLIVAIPLSLCVIPSLYIVLNNTKS